VAAPQAVPAAANVSPGQVVDVPLQVSATSQMLCAGRQTVPAGARASAGQVADVPEQVSGASHPLATGRQTVPAAANLSAGHAAEVPVQVSAASQVLVDARQSVVAGANPSAGQALVVPLQVSGTSHTPFALRQTVPSTATASVGQVNDDPLQVSAASQAPFWARQTVPLDAAEQVPTWPARLHTPQPPLQAVSQQTPFAQNPVAHWLFDVHCKAKDPSKNTDVATAAVPLFEPPANRIKLLFRRVAVWPWSALGSDDVAVQVVVPFHTSAEARGALPEDPPATNTCPFSTMADGRSVAVWSCRAAVRVPADEKLPDPEAALKRSVVFSVELPDRPPATSTFPLASAVAVWPSRALESAVRLLQVEVPSKSWTFVTEAVPELPPTTMTLLLSVVFPDTLRRVALWNFTACGIVPVAVYVPAPEDGL
jgi:hypothetical protein